MNPTKAVQGAKTVKMVRKNKKWMEGKGPLTFTPA